MNSYLSVIAGLLLVTSMPTVRQDELVSIHRGFLTGRMYLERPVKERRAYAMGLVDGMLLSPFFQAQEQKVIWLETYVEEMTNDQVEQILSLYLRDHPTVWHRSVHTAMYFALQEGCPKE